ncbi:hypothetical protein PISL3812_01694 [Talaromyces islandicus]|uniref:hydroxyacylglutathione hydrolase n=1 Tax=Talaromyces islandicus TaxID=28573 RepID=A0A0U1LN39_TALIS|nr:hypothetical protein PISL3812_01694 [Talaromyces islandicus]
MPKIIFTPWRDSSELLNVRSQFYPPSPAGPDLRVNACRTVEAWKLRNHLPHAVEATALLTDAILHDDAAHNSVFSIRATYAAAFCRFVTGLVDSKLGGQRRTMFQRALDLGLPASFVELRHEATHRELPSLVVLRGAVHRSLEWLWGYYWGRLDVAPISTGGGCHLNSRIRDSLRQISQQQQQLGSAKRKAKAHAVVAAAQSLAGICQQENEGTLLLCRALLDKDMLKQRQPGASMDSTFSTWDVLLQTIADSHPPFLTTLTEEMAMDLGHLAEAEPEAEAVFFWLRHILESRTWEAQRPRIPVSFLRAICCEMPNTWTAKLEEHTLAKLSFVSADADAPVNLDVHVDDGWDALEAYGWGPAKHWSTQTQTRKMHIRAIPMWAGKSNNYAYLVTDEPTKQSVIVDPAHPEEYVALSLFSFLDLVSARWRLKPDDRVVPVLTAERDAGRIKLNAIINTHHHWDHAGGNDGILKSLGQLAVIGGKDCQSVTKTPAHGETWKLGDRITVKALHTPCHTQDSICYFLEDGEQRAVFTGDTLFTGGCGRFFEGNAAEMHKALNQTLAALPDDTKVYSGHEYTKSNVKFLVSVSQTPAIQKLAKFAEENQNTQGVLTIGDEKAHNVFMMLDHPDVLKATGKTDPVDVMAALRELKNAM